MATERVAANYRSRTVSDKGELKECFVKFDQTEIRDGVWKIADDVSFKKVHRESPTLGEKPPTGAVVLFDGSGTENFENGRMTDDGLLQQGCTSKQKFGSHQLHLEFRLPYSPKSRGQGRGNSGLYLQGRYEVQMLDSFGSEEKDNECGGKTMETPFDIAISGWSKRTELEDAPRSIG